MAKIFVQPYRAQFDWRDLHSVTVLDVVEEIADVYVDQVEQADRAYWEKKSEFASLAVMDKIVSSLRTD